MDLKKELTEIITLLQIVLQNDSYDWTKNYGILHLDVADSHLQAVIKEIKNN